MMIFIKLVYLSSVISLK